MSFAFVTSGIMSNIELLIGPFEPHEDGFEGNGFVAAIRANLKGDQTVVTERLRQARVLQMLRAAVEAMVTVRARALRRTNLDPWAMKRLRWVADWIKQQGLKEPSADDIREAGLEYAALPKAA